MATALQGQDVVILIENPAGSGSYSALAKQKNVQFKGTTPTIDTSGKEDQVATFVPGRISETMTLDALYVEGEAEYAALRNAFEKRIVILVQRQQRGVVVKQGQGIITDITEGFQDQQAATLQATVQISGGWEDLAAA